MIAAEQARHYYRGILGRLRLVREKPSRTGVLEFLAHCPAHDDHSPSLVVSVRSNGTLVAFCRAGCRFEAIAQALGSRPGDWFFRADGEVRAVQPTVVKKYPYRRADGSLSFEVWRYEPKSFRPVRSVPGTQFKAFGLCAGLYSRRPESWRVWPHDPNRPVDGLDVVELPEADLVPYNLPQLLAAGPTSIAAICEGERDADTATKLGFIGTTTQGGARNWRPSYARYFGGKSVIICRDNNEAGHEYARSVAYSLLTGFANPVRLAVVTPSDQPNGDLSDWAAADGGCAEEAYRFDKFQKLLNLADAAGWWGRT